MAIREMLISEFNKSLRVLRPKTPAVPCVAPPVHVHGPRFMDPASGADFALTQAAIGKRKIQKGIADGENHQPWSGKKHGDTHEFASITFLDHVAGVTYTRAQNHQPTGC
jgi:hypothetical protein